MTSIADIRKSAWACYFSQFWTLVILKFRLTFILISATVRVPSRTPLAAARHVQAESLVSQQANHYRGLTHAWRLSITIKLANFAARILSEAAGLGGGYVMQYLLVTLCPLIVFDQNHEEFTAFILE